MSDRTPPMSAIRSAWAKAHPFPLTTDVDERYAEFDRWLAAHDAEVRAGVVAEEPEWEYGYRLVGDDGNVYKTGFAYDNPVEPSERAKMRADEENEVREETGEPRLAPELIRRRKAGSWVPVGQEGTG